MGGGGRPLPSWGSISPDSREGLYFQRAQDFSPHTCKSSIRHATSPVCPGNSAPPGFLAEMPKGNAPGPACPGTQIRRGGRHPGDGYRVKPWAPVISLASGRPAHRPHVRNKGFLCHLWHRRSGALFSGRRSTFPGLPALRDSVSLKCARILEKRRYYSASKSSGAAKYTWGPTLTNCASVRFSARLLLRRFRH